MEDVERLEDQNADLEKQVKGLETEIEVLKEKLAKASECFDDINRMAEKILREVF